MDAFASLDAPSVFDLRAVDEAQRAALWSRTAGDFFPGLSVRDLRANPSLGQIKGIQFGAGRLWTVLSPPLQVCYDPANSTDGPTQLFSVLMQLEESMIATQNQRACRLRRGEFCVIDSRRPFELEVTGLFSQFMVLQIPRYAVLDRHPYLERCTAEPFDPNEPGAALVRQILLSVMESAPYLENEQRATALAAIIQLLGMPRTLSKSETATISWRVRAALAYIDAELGNHELNASCISSSQKISRRRLDEIMVKAVGTSVTSQIWIRRLARAAANLLDSKLGSKTVSEIAFAVGFEDAAHFTRAFKRRYGQTPRDWRARAASASTLAPDLEPDLKIKHS